MGPLEILDFLGIETVYNIMKNYADITENPKSTHAKLAKMLKNNLSKLVDLVRRLVMDFSTTNFLFATFISEIVSQSSIFALEKISIKKTLRKISEFWGIFIAKVQSKHQSHLQH